MTAVMPDWACTSSYPCGKPATSGSTVLARALNNLIAEILAPRL